ncbi:MAG: YggT family protein [Anaeromicrobium sp.]|uniref:YggT family protein n=1 Tax=Anaeromicrobium sp. TaxID=1929132 RepID=UPI0025F0755A|nr:YggT family protein [Anaeromicrobium sp.]MCT4592898.1 YggT family protein [Anaeromicrobium sp.]
MYMLKVSVNYFFRVIEYLVIARILLSWISNNPYGGVYGFLHQVTEPILAPFRELSYRIGLGGGMIDLSPIFVILFLQLVNGLINSIL